eukprot:TRINITY_DN2085_c0_g1_i1.p1 TRINITY_DN2085_c0_g1~~TRINITY_DN2085_c0_g1_i1.p1  ORF type:complete len:291 (-),score=58.03 TRINITY_DN2085_c0_g1_i1:23-895(-)
MNLSAIKNPDFIYLLASITFRSHKPLLTLIDSTLKQKEIDYGFSDKTFNYSLVCIVEPRPTASAPQSSCEEAAIFLYIDLEAWKAIDDLHSFCYTVSQYTKGVHNEALDRPRVHLILCSVKERITGKQLENWTVELYEEFIASVMLRYNFDIAEFSSENEAVQYIAELALAYSEFRERRKMDKQKKILPVASKGIKGNVQSDSKLSVWWMAGLACIPGISESKARAIAKLYPTMKSLMDEYDREKGMEEKKKLLSSIKFAGEDKGSKIGNKLSERVFKYFTSTNPNETLN